MEEVSSIILVSSNERREIKTQLEGEECVLPFDFLIFTSRGPVARERKHFPGDLLASVRDGRLAKECAAMREVSEFPGVILEGKPRYRATGELFYKGSTDYPSGWTRVGIRNLCRSIFYVESCYVEWTDSIADTVASLKETAKYFEEEHHSIRIRPKAQGGDFLMPTYEERLRHFYQGLPGISFKLGQRLVEAYPTPMHFFVNLENLEVKGIGRGTLQRIRDFIQGG